MISGRSEQEIAAEIYQNFTTVPDIGEEWATFEEVLVSWQGDCEDAVTLYLGMVYMETGKKLKAGVYYDDGHFHAAVLSDLYDYPYTPFRPGKTLDGWLWLASYTYDEWMLITHIL